MRINKSRKEQWKDSEGKEAPELKGPDTIVVTTDDNGYVTLPDGCYDPDGNISIGTENITLGDAIASVPDAISWNNQVFTTPTTIAPPQATQSGELPVDPEKNAEELNNRDGD